MWEEGVRIYGTPGVHNNFPIKIYWGMNLMLLFGENFNALLWYVCSQIKYIKMYWGMNLLLCCDKFASK